MSAASLSAVWRSTNELLAARRYTSRASRVASFEDAESRCALRVVEQSKRCVESLLHCSRVLRFLNRETCALGYHKKGAMTLYCTHSNMPGVGVIRRALRDGGPAIKRLLVTSLELRVEGLHCV